MSERGQVQDYLLRVVQIPARHTRIQNTSVDRSLELCSNFQLKNIHVPSSSKTRASLLAGLLTSNTPSSLGEASSVCT